jgi:hypothetical protein
MYMYMHIFTYVFIYVYTYIYIYIYIYKDIQIRTNDRTDRRLKSPEADHTTAETTYCP